MPRPMATYFKVSPVGGEGREEVGSVTLARERAAAALAGERRVRRMFASVEVVVVVVVVVEGRARAVVWAVRRERAVVRRWVEGRIFVEGRVWGDVGFGCCFWCDAVGVC